MGVVTDASELQPQKVDVTPDVTPEQLAVIREHVQRYSCADDVRAAGHAILTTAGCTIIPFVLYTRVPWLLVVPLTILHGLFVMKGFIVFHDAGHNSFFSTRRLNDMMHVFMSWLILTPPFWAKTHVEHHANSGNMDQENYPWSETIFHTVREYKNMSPAFRAAYRVLRDPAVFYYLAAGYKWVIYYRLPWLVNSEYPPMELLVNTTVFALWIYLMQCIHPWYAVWLVISWIVGASFGVLLFHGQHSYNPCYVATKADAWKHSDAALKGSSLIWIPPPLRWFTMGIEYHHIHHLSTKIPGYKMKECHETAGSLMDGVVRLGPRELWKTWQNVLYDEDAGCIVSFSQIKPSHID